ncbi:MAG: endonuclease/exonuclease/phosphatase family protein [Myxococcales bacterium]|nr:endonuclease/exonuclease/phosphatase family protein [Myxococcales bacterium]
MTATPADSLPAPPRRPGALDKIAVAAAALYVLGVIVATVIMERYVDRWWPATVLAFAPRWPLPFLALPVGLLAVMRRRFLWTGLVVVAGLLAAGPYMGLCLPFPRHQAEGSGKTLRVATYNIQQRDIHDPFVERVVRDLDADVLLLVECRSDPAGRLELYNRHVATVFGLCLFSRLPMLDSQARDPKDAWERNGSGAILRATLEADGQPFTVVGLHLATVRDGLQALRWQRFAGVPEMEKNAELRRWESEIARTFSDDAQGPLLVMGDLNMPVESDIYRRYWSDFVNAFDECGFGYAHTKHTRWFGVRIDHILMNAGFRCEDVAVLDREGSDHSPLTATLTLRGPD